jgi:hypothetical protein
MAPTVYNHKSIFRGERLRPSNRTAAESRRRSWLPHHRCSGPRGRIANRLHDPVSRRCLELRQR